MTYIDPRYEAIKPNDQIVIDYGKYSKQRAEVIRTTKTRVVVERVRDGKEISFSKTTGVQIGEAGKYDPPSIDTRYVRDAEGFNGYIRLTTWQDLEDDEARRVAEATRCEWVRKIEGLDWRCVNQGDLEAIYQLAQEVGAK